MISISATEARKRLYPLLDDLADSHHPIQITGNRSSAVQDDSNVDALRIGRTKVGAGRACGRSGPWP